VTFFGTLIAVPWLVVRIPADYFGHRRRRRVPWADQHPAVRGFLVGGKNLLGVVFVDLGDAWGGDIADDPFVLGDTSFEAHLGYGAGIRVRTPIGPLRLDLGFSEEGTETHFGLSHMF